MLRALTITTKVYKHPDGFLEVTIYEASNLPNTDASAFSLFGASNDVTDPLVSIYMNGVKLARTRCINNTLNPVWNEHSTIPLYGDLKDVKINVLDADLIGEENVASVTLKIAEFTKGEMVDGWFDLMNMKEKNCGKIGDNISEKFITTTTSCESEGTTNNKSQ